jgi:hypothetical protein
MTTDNKDRMTVVEAAAFLGFDRQFLDRRSVEGNGPEYLKLGGRVFYERSALETWLHAQRRRSTSDAA